MSHEERNGVISAFNDPHSGLEVLLTNFRVAGAGLNLQFVCHHGQIWSQPWNGNIQDQGIGRLVRFGQTKEVHFKIYIVCGTLYERRLMMLLRKYATQHAATHKVPNLRGPWGMGVMYELFAHRLGHPYSFYVFQILRPGLGAMRNPFFIQLASSLSELICWALGNVDRMDLMAEVPEVCLVGAALSHLKTAPALTEEWVQQHVSRANAVDAGEILLEKTGGDIAYDRYLYLIEKTAGRTPKKTRGEVKDKGADTPASKHTNKFLTPAIAVDSDSEDDSSFLSKLDMEGDPMDLDTPSKMPKE